MTWTIQAIDGQFKIDGELYPNRFAAASALASLVLSAGKAKETTPGTPLLGCVSFSELEELQEAAEPLTKQSQLDEYLPILLQNIANDNEVINKADAAVLAVAEYMERSETHTKSPVKLENGMQFPAGDYGLVPDPSRPTTWRVRVAETPGNVTVRQLVKATAELTRGMGGERIPDAARTAIKRRILAEFRKLGIDERAIPPQVKEKSAETDSGMMFWKDAASGLYQWMAIYSNNFLDNDHPREIITEGSHLNFVDLVNTKQVSYPELWLWHIPGTRFGQATWVDYIDGFAVAGGCVDAGHEKQAENLAQMSDLRVSHGMPRPLVVYDPNDSRSIIFHVTAEISPLPGWAAANPHTGFTVFNKEADEMLSDAKKAFLKAAGIPDARIAQLDADLSQKKDAASAEGRESKEKTEQAPAENNAAGGQAAKETADPAPTTDPAAPAYITRDELVTAMAELLSPMIEQLGVVTAQVAAMDTQVKSLATSEGDRIAKAAEVTPQASLAELIAGSIVGQEKARLDGRSNLAKAGPKEKEAPPVTVTGIPFLDAVIAGKPQQGQGE